MFLLNRSDVRYVHLAPPCGTFSRAREFPISAAARRRGVKEPKPLRSTSLPLGLDGLQGSDKERVSKGNALMRAVVRIVEWASAAGIFWSVENPRKSLFWYCPNVAELALAEGTHDVDLQSCRHRVHWLEQCGSARAVWIPE